VLEEEKAPAEPKEWKDPALLTDRNRFVESYQTLRQQGLDRGQAEEALARYVVGLVDNASDDDYNSAFEGVSPEAVLKEYLGLRDPGFFGALAEGAGRGVVSAVPTTGGFYGGFRAGMALPGPAAIRVPAAIGMGLAGAFGGALAGQAAESAVFPETNVVPYQLPAVEAGRTAGSTVGGLPASTALIRMIPAGAAQILENTAGLKYVTKAGAVMGEAARKAPVSFTMGQTPGAVGAAAGAGAAEVFDPGDFSTRLISETLGSFLYPMRLAGGAAGAVLDETKGSTGPAVRFLKSSQERAAARTLIEAIMEFGDDPQRIADALAGRVPLMGADGKEIKLPIEVITQSPALAALANAAARRSPGVSQRRAESFEDANQAISALIKTFSATGTPEALQVAADMRRKLAEAYVTAMVTDPLDRAQKVQALATARLAPGAAEGEAARRFGETVYKIVDDSITAWRAAENKAWGSVDLANMSGEATNVLAAWEKLKANTLIPETEGNVPKIVKDFVDRVSGTGEFSPPLPNLPGGENLFRLRNQAEAAQKKVNSFADRIDKKYSDNPGSPMERKSLGQDFRELFSYFLGDFTKEEYDLVRTVIEPGYSAPTTSMIKSAANEDGLATLRNVFERMLGSMLVPADDSSIPATVFPTDNRNAVIATLRDYIGMVDARMTALPGETALRDFEAARAAGTAAAPSISLYDIQKFRADMLARAREARSKNEFFDARIYSTMAEAALDDLGVSEKAVQDLLAKGVAVSPEQQAILDAMAVSRAGNDIFTRTFAGEVVEKSRAGGLRIIPELLAREFVNTADDVAASRFAQLQNAIRNTPGVNPNDAAARAATVDSVTDYLFRTEASKYVKPTEIVDPVTGNAKTVQLFDEAGLQRFLDDNRVLLDMPAMRSLRNDLRDVVTANNTLAARTTEAGKLAKDIERDAWFSRLLGGDSPATAFASALGHKTRPETEFRKLLQVLKKDPGNIPGPGADSAENLRLAVRDNVFAVAQMRATRPDGTLDVQKFRDVLYKPLSPTGGKSVMDILMEDKVGVVDKTFRDKMNLLLGHLDSVQSAMKFKTVYDAPVFNENLAEQYLIRFVGANIGGNLSGGAPSLQTASFGAQAMRKLFEHVPTSKATDLLTLAMEPTPKGRELFRRLLQRGMQDSPMTAQGLLSPATSALERAVLRIVGAPVSFQPAVQRSMEEVVEPPTRQQQLVPPPEQRRPPSAPPPAAAPARPAMPPPPTPARPAPPPPAAPIQQQGSVTSPDSRARFAALFPDDFVSSMIR